MHPWPSPGIPHPVNLEEPAMPQPPAAWLSYASLTAAAILWASSFIALKVAFRAYDPMVVIFGRMAVACACFVWFVPRFRSTVHYRRGDGRRILAMAFCEPCLYFHLEARALTYTSASQAGMITALLPLMVAVCARMFLNESLTPRTVVGFALAIVGAGWLSAAGAPTAEAPRPILGNFLEFLAMVCATGYIINMKHLTYRYPSFFLTAVQAFIGALFFLPFLGLSGTRLPVQLEPLATAAVVYLGAAVTLGAYGLYNFGVSRVPASQAGAFINLIPVFTVALGWVFLGERFTGGQYLASLLVFAGLAISQSRARKHRRRGVS
jgi:drug/metabolite transporter (DMT)-like permease